MRYGRPLLSAMVFAGTALAFLSAFNPPLRAQAAADAAPPSGLWLTTDYPERSVDFGETIRVSLDLINKNLPPERVELSVADLPADWTAEINGGGTPISAAMVGTDRTVSLNLNLTPPKDAEAGSYGFEVLGKTPERTLRLPIALSLKAPEPARLSLEPKLPNLRGTAESSFDFELTLKNESLEDSTVTLAARAPDGFEVAFTEGYGSQEITSLPIEAGASKTVKAKVDPPQNLAAGQYKVQVSARSEAAQAAADLQLQVTGQPTIALAGPNGMLSGTATAGEERDFTFTVANSGSAPARNLTVRANAPSGWTVEVEPKSLGALAPDQREQVSVQVTPGEKAVAGDYMMTLRAASDGASNSADFRVTVMTSTLWGVTGLIVIVAALLVLAIGIRRYGRR